MPHKCTRCEGIFRDGAAIILNGCPKCGWNKFLYVKDDTAVPAAPAEKTAVTTIPTAATQFIKEVDELLAKPVKPEPKESKVEKKKEKEEIGDRVESVRILSPGSYELNLDSIMKRDEIVMALKEDGTYIVHLPSVFQKKKHQER